MTAFFESAKGRIVQNAVNALLNCSGISATPVEEPGQVMESTVRIDGTYAGALKKE